MIIDTTKLADQAKAALKTTKGKVIAGGSVIALAAIVAIPAIAHEGFGERGEHGHRKNHSEMSHEGCDDGAGQASPLPSDTPEESDEG